MWLSRSLPLALAALGSSYAFAAGTCGGSEQAKPDPAGTSKTGASAELKAELPGVDISALTAREKAEWAVQVNELLAPCPDVPVSIAQCVREKRACKTCLPAAQFMAKQVRRGLPKEARAEAFKARFDPKGVKTIVLDDSPAHGPPDAAVTIVEWADFQCPFCALMSPALDGLEKRFEGQVRVVFKNYPLVEKHPNAMMAARASWAAHQQGKFWELHHLMFQNQDKLEQPELEKLAKKVGLDLTKLREDLVSKSTTERIEKDMKQAESLGLKGTPMLFINGREVVLELLSNPLEDLEDWVKLDLELAGITPKPAPKVPGSSEPGSPSASPSSEPSAAPSAAPSTAPSAAPSAAPSTAPSAAPKK